MCRLFLGNSEAPAVQGHDAWQGTIFALQVLSGAIEFIMERLSDLSCPCDPLCVSQNVCNAVKETIITIFSIIFQVTLQVGAIRNGRYHRCQTLCISSVVFGLAFVRFSKLLKTSLSCYLVNLML